MSPLALSRENFSKVTTVLDASLSETTSPLAVRGLSSTVTVFLSAADLLSYLRNLESDTSKIHEVDFVALKADVAADGSSALPNTTKPEKKKVEKEDAKIEGAIQVAIGVKKEVDFATWYTNVSTTLLWYVWRSCPNPRRQ